jgi:hypothetical protein
MTVALMFVLYVGCDRQKEIGVTTLTMTDNDANSQGAGCEYAGQFTVLQTGYAAYSDENQGEFQNELGSGEVQYAISKFNSMGYALDLEHSSVMEGTGVPNWPGGSSDTIDVRIVNIILRYLPDSLNSFVWISCVSSPNHPDLPSYITTAIWSFVLPGDDISGYEVVELGRDEYGVDRYIWIKDLVLPFDPKGNDALLAAWSWKKWGICTAIGSVGGCVTSAIGCAASGPGYALCFAGWCGGSIVGSAVVYALGAWFL